MSDERDIEELVSRWESAQAAGRDVTIGDLCGDRPELASRLEQRIATARRFSEVVEAAKAHVVAVPFDQVVSVCESFTGEWKPVARTPLDSYLEQVDQEVQPTLFRNLLAIDLEQRRAAGEQPGIEEYLDQYPQFAALIRGAFLHLSTVIGESDRQTGGAATLAPQPVKSPAANCLGNYRLLRELGRGGMGVVYEAQHLQRGNRVALKTLPIVDGAALHRFKHEFRSLADINHPNLVGLHTLEADGCHWFFTMDLLEGKDFLSHVRPGDQLDEARLRTALSQLVIGVMALHGHHIVHRDLKPSNVVVQPDGQVVLLDFGLVVELGELGVSVGAGEIAGTPRYMAPEQAAGQPVTPACDWYAVGVMLYEALAGRPVFDGSRTRVLYDKQHSDPPTLVGTPGIADDLATFCMKLLAREPRERPDPLDIARTIAGQTAPASVVTASGERLVGRTAQLASLKAAYQELEKNWEPVTAFVSGRSGEGKTALIEHFLGPLRRDPQLTVMSGRCYDRESVPFKALDSLIDALATFLRSLSEVEANGLIPPDISVLAQVFPVLQRVELIASSPRVKLAELDELQVRQRSFVALRNVLRRISERKPLIFFVDDLQWGDADSAQALFEVLRPPEAPYVLFLGSFRSDEADSSPFLRTWDELQRRHGVSLPRHDVKVAPLTLEECTELVVTLLERDSEAIRRRAVQFATETGGNPFLLIELVGCFDPEADSFQPMEMHEVLARKLGRLPAEAERLLHVVAVSGHSLSLDEASRTAGHIDLPVATVTRMRNERLVRTVGTEESPLVDTYHDRIRATVLGRMEPVARRAIHKGLAEVIERDTGWIPVELAASLQSGSSRADADEPALPRVFDLSYHFDAAGETQKACTYALLAAEQARRQLSLEVAANQYAVAKRNAEPTARAVRYRLAEGSGKTLILLGRYDDAAARLTGAVDLSDDPVEKARIELLQGEIAVKTGALDASVRMFRDGLHRLGERVPRTRLGFAVKIIQELFIQCGHSLFPGRLHAKPPDSRRTLAIQLLNRLSHAFFFQNTIKFTYTHPAALNRAEELPPSSQLAFANAAHSVFMSAFGWHSRAARYSQRSIEIADRLNDLWARGQALCYRGMGCYASGRFEEGVTVLTEAISTLLKTGDLWESNLAHFHKGCCHYGLGDLAEAIAEARTTYESSVCIGEDTRAHCAVYLWAKATNGNLPLDKLKSCFRSIPEDILSTNHYLIAKGHWHSFHGRTEQAVEAFEQAYRMAKDNLLINFHTAVMFGSLAGALRLHAEATEDRNRNEGDRLRRRALRLARWGARVSRFFPVHLPYSLRELSLILAAHGKTKQALRAAEKSCAVAQGQKAKYEHARSLLVRGKLAHQLGLPEAQMQIQTAEAAIAAIESGLTRISHSL